MLLNVKVSTSVPEFVSRLQFQQQPLEAGCRREQFSIGAWIKKSDFRPKINVHTDLFQ